jgi:hypothetical protein
MKPVTFALLILLPGLGACTVNARKVLPEITVVSDQAVTQKCQSLFFQGEWQFVHTIDFSLAGGTSSTVIGVTSLAADSLTCLLTTVEGFTLFQATARDGKGIAVQRAVPPFDRPAFAEGLLEDVRTIFLAPQAPAIQSGFTPDEVATCRYLKNDGRTTDVLQVTDEHWQIQTYDAGQRLERFVALQECQKEGNALIPKQLELKGFGQTDYTLKMTLIHAEKLHKSE